MGTPPTDEKGFTANGLVNSLEKAGVANQNTAPTVPAPAAFECPKIVGLSV